MKVANIPPILVLSMAFLFSNCSGSTESFEKTIRYGPFEIKIEASSGSSFDLDKGKVGWTRVAYTILHDGKPVPFPKELQTNTGLPYLWQVYALADAPEPTLLAGSQSLYLIYLQDGAPVVQPILEQSSDFASLQFLDSENGRPGPYFEVFARNSTDNLDRLDSLQGGRFLMLGEKAVLDVQTRSVQPFHLNNHDVDHYNFPTPHGALAFSPDQKSIVFRANFQTWDTADEDLPDTEKALVVYDYRDDKGYAVIFDDNDMRLLGVDEMDYDWFTRFFEWENSGSGDRLAIRKLETQPYWSGRFKVEYETSPYYTLYPVKAGMLPVFLAFLEQHAGLRTANIVEDKYHEYTGRIITFAAEGLKFDVTFMEDSQTLLFGKHLYSEGNQEYVAKVKEIADAFESELAAGNHQEHFGKIISETRQIRNLGKQDQ